MWISESKFKQVFPNAVSGIYSIIDKHIEKAGCKTKEQQAMFLAQCGVECAGYKTFEENLNYSATALLATFPKYFTQHNVVLYARNKQAIANRVYANRMGNGNERSGDGWKYRGRGLIQITGKANYIDFAKWEGLPSLVTDPDQITKNLALTVQVAVWYWVSRKLSEFSDILTVTKKINGGTHGLTQRTAYYKKLMAD
ncbi:TPA: glycoside hydrolase family 19 protein [Mannheimia haemolytica]|uniref:glycoside hydrolase family 19 protein n=1 Tax=Mannheimia haemolytica TaxID=75985 RepID=UPI001E4345DD|nr:glycoside hydrolase family 19 protein [Mannheimia haemolytica]UFK42058.1 glycoside hydrolase family 19 protein [Mannheimia haemolytica]HDL1113759.1 glycoside hydrolase family 19 protein [Mannheimia haemolytica]HDL1116210.1 glycoside hydrolase family 19 protein [Mannheimia haemolytica]HDL1124846.1 glycoside hydrolase family 19 protein [Mannheimia haemolytica]HDL1126994.1 glycoside hydrolase family 19 protein [Mannheimia haemolytica]